VKCGGFDVNSEVARCEQGRLRCEQWGGGGVRLFQRSRPFSTQRLCHARRVPVPCPLKSGFRVGSPCRPCQPGPGRGLCLCVFRRRMTAWGRRCVRGCRWSNGVSKSEDDAGRRGSFFKMSYIRIFARARANPILNYNFIIIISKLLNYILYSRLDYGLYAYAAPHILDVH